MNQADSENELKPATSPWQSIYSVDRTGVTELLVSGIIAVVANDQFDFSEKKLPDVYDPSSRSSDSSNSVNVVLERGDVDYRLWTRSLLKPFQLASHLRIVCETYPTLSPAQLALMSSSHSCESLHLELLGGIMEIGQVGPSDLRCPPVLPENACAREQYRLAGKEPSSLYHNCSGKHFSYLMSLKAQGLPIHDYTDFENVEHKRLEKLLASLLKRPADSFSKTTDGCQLPNHALSIKEIATLYQQLAQAAGRLIAAEKGTGRLSDPTSYSGPIREYDLGFVGRLMHLYPEILGGTNRLDTRLMSGEFTTGSTINLLAKDGADGLLAISVLPTESYPKGLGIVIKLASGYDIRHMETIATEIFERLGLPTAGAESGGSLSRTRTDHLKTKFTFGLESAIKI